MAVSHMQVSTNRHLTILKDAKRGRGVTLGVGLDLDVVDVLVAVRLLPELLDNLVDVRHLGRVERQQRLLQRLAVRSIIGKKISNSTSGPLFWCEVATSTEGRKFTRVNHSVDDDNGLSNSL